jgi:hypothetical protein
MAVSKVVTLAATASGGGWTAVVNSANVTAGDVIFVLNTNGEGTGDPTISDDSGDGDSWTKIDSGLSLNGTAWWKRVSGGSWGSSNVTISGSGNTNTCSAGYTIFRGGQSSATPYENLSYEQNVSGNETHAGFTPTYADSYLFAGIFNFPLGNAPANETFGVNAATEDYDSAGSGVRCTSATLLQSGGPTATGNFTWTQGNAATVSVLFSIPPDQGGGAASILPLVACDMRNIRDVGGMRG